MSESKETVVKALEGRRAELLSELNQIDTLQATLAGAPKTAEAIQMLGKRALGKPRKMTAAGRAAISRAAKKRWAAFRRGAKPVAKRGKK